MKPFEKTTAGLREIVQYYITEYMRLDPIEVHRDAEQIENFISRKQSLSRELDCASYSDASIRMNVKTLIGNILMDKDSRMDQIRFSLGFTGISDDFVITPKNIEDFLSFHPSKLTSEMKFRVLLEHHKKSEGKNAVVHMLQKYGWDHPKEDPAGEQSYFISVKNVDDAYRKEGLQVSFAIKKDILIQLIYEETYGNRKVDELLYQRTLEGVSVGAYGIPDDTAVTSFLDIKLPKAYDAVSITYMDVSIRLEFMSFGSNDGLEDVVRKLIRSVDGLPMHTKRPYYHGDRQGSDRIVAAQPPFAECYMAWIRIHGRKHNTIEELVTGKAAPKPPEKPPENYELILEALMLLMRGQANLNITGPQNVGKSSLMSALVKYYDEWLRIRSAEGDSFEAKLRSMFPLRNIGSFRETTEIDMKKSYEFSLRTEGQVALLPEVRRDNVFAQVITTGNRGVYCCMLTSHPKNAKSVPLEMGNSLLTAGYYQSLTEAIRSVLDTLPFCLEVRVDKKTGFRYYNLYEFRPVHKRIADFRQVESDKLLALLESYAKNVFQQEGSFETVPIVKFNIIKWRYEKLNNFSSEEAENLFYNMSRDEDRDLLKKYSDLEVEA